MPAKLTLLALVLTLASCEAREPVSIPSDYDGAVRAVRRAYSAEKWKPDSSTIHSVEYFPGAERRFLIVTFKRNGGTSKPYIYEGFPVTLWRAWKAAPSAGSWYHANLRGNTTYFFRK